MPHARSVLARAVSALLPALALVAAPAGAATAQAPSPPPRLHITLTPDGFTIPGPNPRPAGYVTLDVDTAVPGGQWLALMRPKPGVSFQQVMTDFTDAESPDPAVAIPALRAEYRDTDFLGGTSVFPGRPVALTQWLGTGRTYLVGTSPTGDTHINTLDATGHIATSRPPRPVGTIEVTGRRTPVFHTPARLPATGTLRFRNHYRLPEEAIFERIKPGATHASIQAYLEASLRGGQLPPDPFLGTAGGSLAISPGRSDLVHIDFPPGHYSVLSFLLNPDTQVKQAYEGLHTEFWLCGGSSRAAG